MKKHYYSAILTAAVSLLAVTIRRCTGTGLRSYSIHDGEVKLPKQPVNERRHAGRLCYRSSTPISASVVHEESYRVGEGTDVRK